MTLTHNLSRGGIGGIMTDFGPGRKLVGRMIVASALWVLPTAGWAYTAEQQQACMGDAFSLCGSEIPDVQRTTACMVRKQAQLSPGCRADFRPEPQQVSERPRRQHRPYRQHFSSDY